MQPELSDVAESVLLRAYSIAIQPRACLEDAVYLRGSRPLLAGDELRDAGLAVFHCSGRLLLTPKGVAVARQLKAQTVRHHV